MRSSGSERKGWFRTTWENVANPRYRRTSRKEDRSVFRVARAIFVFLQQLAQAFIDAHRTEPLLEVYMNDATPLKYQYITSRGYKRLRVRRKGVTSREVVLQRRYLRSADTLSSKGELVVECWPATPFETKKGTPPANLYAAQLGPTDQ